MPKVKEMPELVGKEMGLYDSANGATLYTDTAIDVTDWCPNAKQIVIKYTNAAGGRIAQICNWYKEGVDFGAIVHYFISEMTPIQLANDSVFESHARMFGVDPLLFSVVIFENSNVPEQTKTTIPQLMKWEYRIIADVYFSFLELNKIGIDGWELVSVVQGGRNSDIYRYDYYFKRPLPEPSIPPPIN